MPEIPRTPGERFRQIKEESRRRAEALSALTDADIVLEAAKHQREEKMKRAATVLKAIRARWEKAASTIDGISCDGGCHFAQEDKSIVEAVSVRLGGLRFPICLYAHQDVDSGFYTFTCECDGESRRFSAQRIEEFEVRFADKIFNDFLEWWAPMVT